MNILFLKKEKNEKKNIKNIFGSKSISNRILLISSFCKNQITKIKNLSNAEDVKIMINFLKKTKINIYKKKKDFYILGNLKKIKTKKVYLKNAGTVVRPIFFLSNFFTKKSLIIEVNKSMQKRTINDLYKVSKKINGSINFIKNKGYLPSINFKSKINYKKIKINCNNSSQYASSLLMIMNIFKKKNLFYLKKITSYFYIILTLKIIKMFGISIKIKKNRKTFIFTNGKYKSCKKIIIENDFSSLSYFFFKSLFVEYIIKFKSLTKKICQGDIKIINCLKKIGMKFFINDFIFFFYYKSKKIRNIKINCIDIPDSSISLILLIFCKVKRIKITNIKSWNFKESNRFISTSMELKKIGSKIKTGKNWMIIKNFALRKKLLLKTYNDHRILMCFSILNKILKMYICNPNCVKKTFENYIFEMFKN